MCVKVCSCLVRRVMFYINKILLWFIKRILKLALYQLIAIALIFICFVFFLIWNPHDKSEFGNLSKNPVILWWTEGFPGSSETKYCPDNIQCDVYSTRNITKHINVEAYLFYGSNIHFDDLPLPRRPEDIIWGLYHEESPRNVEEFMHEAVLKLFNFSSTYSRHSDVPFPLQHLEAFDDITSTKYFIETTVKNSFLKDIAPILYLQSDCETSTERDLYVKELMKIAKIDSYGACLNNKELPEKFTHDYLNNLNKDDFLRFVARYKFVIAIENGVCQDYVTEKFWRAIKVGSVPIYFGCPLINDWLPNNKSAILLQDYPTPALLNNHLNELLNDDDLYNEYLEHKIKHVSMNTRLIREFNERSYQIDSLKTATKFECFICKQIHDRKKENNKINIINKRHYNCPKPPSALQLGVNPKNSWVHSWEYKKEKAKKIYKSVMNN